MSGEPQGNPPTPDAGGRKRSLLPILLGLLLVVGIVATISYFLQRQRAVAEKQATEELKEMGALIVPHQQGYTASVSLNLPGVQDHLDEALPLTTRLIHLTSLNLRGTNVSNGQLAYVGKLKTLIDLNLSETPITDPGLEHLAGLTKVQSMYLSDTAITSAGLPAIAKLRSLTLLGIGGTKISGNLEPLTELSQLQRMIVSGLTLSDADADTLARIPNLRHLDLGGATISEKGLARLRESIDTVSP